MSTASEAERRETEQRDQQTGARGAGTNFLTLAGQTSLLLFQVLGTNLFGAAVWGAYAFGLSVLDVCVRLGLAGSDKGVMIFVAARRAKGDQAGEDRAIATGIRLSVAIGSVLALAVFGYRGGSRPITANRCTASRCATWRRDSDGGAGDGAAGGDDRVQDAALQPPGQGGERSPGAHHAGRGVGRDVQIGRSCWSTCLAVARSWSSRRGATGACFRSAHVGQRPPRALRRRHGPLRAAAGGGRAGQQLPGADQRVRAGQAAPGRRRRRLRGVCGAGQRGQLRAQRVRYGGRARGGGGVGARRQGAAGGERQADEPPRVAVRDAARGVCSSSVGGRCWRCTAPTSCAARARSPC